jgi:3-(3-hydroxy-phenyl)propionate hydroxylase
VTTSPPDLPVLVVGAGPVGLTAALALRARGLDVTVLEAGRQHRSRPGSRAIFYHRQTLQRWEQISPGLGRDIARAGLVWSTKRTYWGERLVFERTYQPPDPIQLPHSTNLAQTDAERLMLAACEANEVRFAWEQEITGGSSTPDGVCLHTAAGTSWRADYVIGADGSHSVLRDVAGVDMQGSRSENAFVIVDVEEDPERPLRPERAYYYEHPAVERRHVLLVPFAGGWRADLMLRESDDPGAYDDPALVANFVGRVLPERYVERVSWVSTYRFLQVVASAFTDSHRRVLLAGEAAHLFAPFGARGLNSGVPDAVGAADAIAAALQAPDPEGASTAVGRFAQDRRDAALYNRDASSKALAHMRANSLSIRTRRRIGAEIARAGLRAGSWLDSSPFGPRAAAKGSAEIY